QDSFSCIQIRSVTGGKFWRGRSTFALVGDRIKVPSAGLVAGSADSIVSSAIETVRKRAGYNGTKRGVRAKSCGESRRCRGRLALVAGQIPAISSLTSVAGHVVRLAKLAVDIVAGHHITSRHACPKAIRNLG